MPIPSSHFPALKARVALQLLKSIGYRIERQRGSHRKLVAEGRLPIGFAFHDRSEVPPLALRRMLVERAGLTDDEIRQLL